MPIIPRAPGAPRLRGEPGEDLLGVAQLLLEVLVGEHALGVAAAAQVDPHAGVPVAGEVGVVHRVADRGQVALAVRDELQDRRHRALVGGRRPPDPTREVHAVRHRDPQPCVLDDLARETVNDPHARSLSPILIAVPRCLLRGRRTRTAARRRPARTSRPARPRSPRRRRWSRSRSCSCPGRAASDRRSPGSTVTSTMQPSTSRSTCAISSAVGHPTDHTVGRSAARTTWPRRRRGPRRCGGRGSRPSASSTMWWWLATPSTQANSSAWLCECRGLISSRVSASCSASQKYSTLNVTPS